MVGPSIVALRPPAHSTCATFSPLRSADWAMDSAWRTPGSNAAVRFANGWPFRWKVLFVEPWTPGHAPVARLYQPAPVLGGAWVRRPFPLADVPFFRKSDMVGMRPCAAYRATMSCLMPSAAKNTAFCIGDFGWVFAWADVFTAGRVGGACRESRERRRRRRPRRVSCVSSSGAPLCLDWNLRRRSRAGCGPYRAEQHLECRSGSLGMRAREPRLHRDPRISVSPCHRRRRLSTLARV